MPAASGIAASAELATLFASANTSNTIRFIKVSIKNESLIHNLTISPSTSFETDLELLQSSDVLEENNPAYILAKVAQSDWLAISYVPDSARVRDKMLYASSRASLLKALGSTLFTDAIFATSKEDLTPDAYAAHKRHLAAPKPLSAREQELAEAESGSTYEGSRARASHVRTGVGFSWPQQLKDVIVELNQGGGPTLIVIEIDRSTEVLTCTTSETTVETLGSSLPPSQPCYALFSWAHEYSSPPRREIVFIYSCPSTSPIRDRMVYSTGALSTYMAIKAILGEDSPNAHLASRKIQSSDPKELSEAYLRAELGLDANFEQSVAIGTSTARDGEEKKAFQRPRGPARKR
ncbi:hypothetical protein H0H81_001496, partial [Sphagnurus paluster]